MLIYGCDYNKMVFDERKRKYGKCVYVIRKGILNQSILENK